MLAGDEAAGPKVTHVITGLAPGGAETLLVRLLEELGEERRHRHRVLSLRPRWALAEQIEALGVPVQALGMNGYPTPLDVHRLRQALREAPADVFQTWMLHSNVLGGLVARSMPRRTPVAWGVHLTKVDRATMGRKAALVQRIEAASSWLVPARIVSCSTSSTRSMEAMRYRQTRIVTIPNGFDVGHFRPDPIARQELRRELKLGADTVVVGHVARYHPVKDHRTLLTAARQVLAKHSNVRFILCGHGVEPGNRELQELVGGDSERIGLLGQRSDVTHLLNAFDLAVSSSSSEALSLAVGEAMSTGLPVVATPSGDSEELVADTGLITPIGDPEAMAAAIGRLVEMDPAQREEMGKRARWRISSDYSLAGMAEGYVRLWDELSGAKGGAG